MFIMSFMWLRSRRNHEMTILKVKLENLSVSSYCYICVLLVFFVSDHKSDQLLIICIGSSWFFPLKREICATCYSLFANNPVQKRLPKLLTSGSALMFFLDCMTYVPLICNDNLNILMKLNFYYQWVHSEATVVTDNWIPHIKCAYFFLYYT